MLPSPVVPQWIARVVAELADATYAELALVILVKPEPVPTRRSLRRALWRLYELVDYRIHAARPDAFARTDVGALVAGHPSLELSDPSTLDGAASRAIEDARLDVILDLPAATRAEALVTAARYGLWTLEHGDSAENAAPGLFWELYERDTVTVTTLASVSGTTDGCRILYRSYSAVHPTSVYGSRNPAYWKSAEFPLRRLRDLHERGWEYVAAQPTADDPKPTRAARSREPTHLEMLVCLGRIAARGIRSKLTYRVNRIQWFIVYRERPDGSSADSTSNVCALLPGRDRLFADPFLLERRGTHYLFFEDFRYEQQKAVISYVELGSDGPSAHPGLALERPYHLSYPFVFELEGAVYMLPETAQARAIELYRAEAFPAQWILDRVLIDDVTALDPTVVVHDGTLWLFASVPAYGARDTDELHVYFAESLAGEWIAHPMNPVVSDVRRARPAGRVFEHAGSLIRPGQDSSRAYGAGVVLNRIDTLTREEYSETEIVRIDASWLSGNRATHTYDSNSRYEVVDAQRLLPKLPLLNVRRGHDPAATVEPLPSRRVREILDRRLLAREHPSPSGESQAAQSK